MASLKASAWPPESDILAELRGDAPRMPKKEANNCCTSKRPPALPVDKAKLAAATNPNVLLTKLSITPLV